MESSSIGIIGGADGPTSVFITGNVMMLPLLIGAAVLALVAVGGIVWAVSHRDRDDE